jgi:predicted GNAT family acetyltransferase
MPSAVRNNTTLSRFEIEADGVTAYANYRLAGNVITIMHTETPPQARGHGIASLLVAGTLETVRARGLKVVPQCPFVRAYIAEHPEYRDLLA